MQISQRDKTSHKVRINANKLNHVELFFKIVRKLVLYFLQSNTATIISILHHIQIFATIEVFSFISFQLVDTKLDAVSIHNYYFVRLVLS